MRKCRKCRTEILPKKQCPDQITAGGFCGMICLHAYGVEKATKARERQKRKEHAELKDKIKTKAEHAREAQAQVNAYVRWRDKGKPCISCDKPDDGSHQRHASHYRSVGACPSLRFNLKNIHASCQQCNTAKSGNIMEYRIRLSKIYGSNLVEWLESQNKYARYEIAYLKRLKKVFARRVNKQKNKYNKDD